MIKSKIVRVPKDHYEKISLIGDKFDIPTTKAFKVHTKLLSLDFNITKKKKNGSGKDIFELEFNE